MKQTEKILNTVQKQSGINADKVEKVVLSYLQIAKDNQLNYNELLQALSFTKESVLQSLSNLSISAIPDTTSVDAK